MVAYIEYYILMYSFLIVLIQKDIKNNVGIEDTIAKFNINNYKASTFSITPFK